VWVALQTPNGTALRAAQHAAAAQLGGTELPWDWEHEVMTRMPVVPPAYTPSGQDENVRQW